MRIERSTPKQEGVSAAAILKFLKSVNDEGHEFHSLMLVKNGKVILERFWKPYAAKYRHEFFSLSKSFTSMGVGIAIDEGLLTRDTLIVDIFKEETEKLGVKVDEKIKKMTIRHLLMMSTGMEYENWRFADEEGKQSNIEAFLSSHIKHEPGTQFFYHTLATYMLSAAITRLTGEKLVDWLKPRLFDPLGIETPYWREDVDTGVSMGGYGLNARTEDIAVFGQFLLNKGVWNGKRLVSASWIEEATTKQIDNRNTNAENPATDDWSQGYGYQFWRCEPEGVFRGDGMYGQYCVVVPEQNFVIAATSNVDMGRVMKLMWKLLEELPGASDDSVQAELDKYDGFSHLKVNESAGAYPNFAAEYVFDKGGVVGERNFLIPQEHVPYSIHFDFWADECLIMVYAEKGKPASDILVFKNKQWFDTTAAWQGAEFYGRAVTYGEWDGDTFTATIWHYETPSKYKYRFTFSDKDGVYKSLKTEVTVGGNFDASFAYLGTAKFAR